MMNDERKPSWEQLVDLIDGQLSSEDAKQINQQMANAPDELTKDLAWLQAFKLAAKTVALDGPTVELRAALRTDFAQYIQKRSTHSEEQTSILQQLVATLTFDSGLQLSPAGLRAPDSGGKRQLVFSTDAMDIVLTLQMSSQSDVNVNGHILPFDDIPLDSFTVLLYRETASGNISDNTSIARTQSDIIGEFSFEALLPATYGLTLESGSLLIDVGPFDAGPFDAT